MSQIFKDFIAETTVKTLKVSNDKIQQTQRNELKESATVAVMDLLTNEGVDCFRTNEGVVIAIDNATTRKTVYFVIDPVVKSMNYDLDDEIQAYEDKLEERAERERKLAEKKKEKATPPRTE